MELTFGAYRLTLTRDNYSRCELRERYDALAEEWHSLIENLGMLNAYDRIFSRLDSAGHLPDLPASSEVLDLGIGTGALSMALQDAAGGPFRLTGVDISSRMLAAAESALPHGRFYEADACQLPFPSDSFDVVMAAHTLEHIDDPLHGFREMVRVAKPGGTVICLMTHQGVWGTVIQRQWRNHLVNRRRMGRWAAACGIESAGFYRMAAKLWVPFASLVLVGKAPA